MTSQENYTRMLANGPWHMVKREDQQRIRCDANTGAGADSCGLPAIACQHGSQGGAPFFYYCEAHAKLRGWEPPRDFYAEACLIARGKSQMLAQREHLEALYAQIEREFDQRERDADYIHDGEFYNNEREPEEDGRDWL